MRPRLTKKRIWSLIHLTRLAYANADDWAERGFKTIDADLDEHGYLAGCEYIDELFKWHREKERRNESA
jgi:hypothetical protein